MKQDRKKILHILSSGYLFVMAFAFPLVFHNNYIDIVQTKKYFFLGVSFLYILLCAAAGFFALASGKKTGKAEKAGSGCFCFCSVDLCALILLAALCFSTMAAEDRADAAWGFSGRYFGAVVLLMGIVCYFLISRFFVMSQNLIWAFLLGSGCVFLLDIFNTFGVDMLAMKDNLDPAQHYFFIGTMGNIDLEAEFGAIMIPIGMAFFVFAKESFSRAVYGAYVFLGFCAMLCCRCDTAVVCIGTIFLLLYGFAFWRNERMKQAQELFLAWIAASALTGIFRILFLDSVYEFDGLCRLAVSAPAVAAETAVWIGAALYVKWIRNKRTERTAGKAGRNLYVVISAAALFFILLAASILGMADGNGMQNGFRIADEFGNYRGYIWKRSFQAYLDAPVLQKMIGYGMNQFSVFIAEYETEMMQRFQSVFVDAHSEYLQMLSTVGIVGAAGYFGMYAFSLRSCVRKMKKSGGNSVAAMAGIFVFTVYFVQGTANNPQVFTTPLYFILMGIFVNLTWEKGREGL